LKPLDNDHNVISFVANDGAYIPARNDSFTLLTPNLLLVSASNRESHSDHVTDLLVLFFAGKANRAYQPYQHRGDSSDGECDEDTAEFQPNRHQHGSQNQYHSRHRRPNHTYQQPGALLNTDTSGTSGNCSDATLTDSELAFTRDATLQLHDGGKSS
jgi:hypothetical protein